MLVSTPPNEELVAIFVDIQDKLFLATKTKVWAWDDSLAGWKEYAGSPKYGIGNCVRGATRIYTQSAGSCFELVDGMQVWKALTDKKVGVIFAEGDNLFSIRQGYLLKYNSIDKKWEEKRIEELDVFNPSHYTGACAKGDKRWVAIRERAKDLYKIDNIAVPREAVWEIDYEFGYEKDITANLNLNNMLGRPFGPMGNLIINSKRTHLLASTETGIWEREIDGDKWRKILSNIGNSLLLALPDLIVAKVNTSILAYQNYEWFKLASIEKKTEFRSSAVHNGNLYIVTFDNQLLKLDLNDKKELGYKKPNIATYLGFSVIKSVRGEDTLYLASKDSLWSYNNSELLKTLAPVDFTINQLVYGRGTVWAASDRGIFKLENGQFVVISEENNEIDRLYVTEKELVFLSQGKLVVQKLSETVRKPITRSYVTDVTVFNNLIYIVGYDNKKLDLPVQVCFLEAYDSNLNFQWKTWGFNATLLKDNMADTRLYRIIPAGDNLLAVAGEVAGGNNIFRWNGKDVSTKTLVSYDAYNDPYNSKSAHMLYYGFVNADTGEVVKGQLSIPRTQAMLSNSNRFKSLSVDNDGNLYLGSLATSKIAGRDETKFLGEIAKPYTNGDAALLKVDFDMDSRNWFTPGHGLVNYFDDRFAVINTPPQSPSFPITQDATPKSLENHDTYLVVW